MSILFVMVPAALVLAASAIAAFVWAARNGQFDEVDTPPVRILFDDCPAEPKSVTLARKNEPSSTP